MRSDHFSRDLASDEANRLAGLLLTRKTDRIVLAESCTAGLVAALLGQVPGISEFLCGSAVTYRESLKQEWLGVSAATLSRHTAESRQTTDEMAIGVLQKTVEATLACAITGHLGPNAPDGMDGQIFVSLADRSSGAVRLVQSVGFELSTSDRADRQQESAKIALELLSSWLSRLI